VPVSDSKYPKLLESDWVAPNATVIGDVKMAEGASLWHGVVVRGDTAAVTIGKNSIIQDLAHIGSRSGEAVVIGENVHIGANAKLDACTLDNFSFVGMGASVQRGGKVESFGVLSAGAVLFEDDVVPSGQIFVGNPAVYLRDLTQEEKHLMAEHKLEMQQLSQIYKEETEKTFREQINSNDDRDKYFHQAPDQKYEEYLSNAGFPRTHEDMEYIEHRIYHDYVGTVDYNMRDMNHSACENPNRTWTPYEQDMTHYPEIFKKHYQENYKAYDL